MWRTNLTETLLSEVMRLSDYELYHHGVKGMKWGVRKKADGDGFLRIEKRFHTTRKNVHDKLLSYHQNRLSKGYRESVLNPFYVRRLGKIKAHKKASEKISRTIEVIDEARRMLANRDYDLALAVTSRARVIGEAWLTNKVKKMSKKS